MNQTPVTIIGGGLAGCEAAWRLARAGVTVRLHEMRPERMTPAHRTGNLAELVCSNSLKSESPDSAPLLLKEELRELGSLLLSVAEEVRLPAGHALAVDRDAFSARVTRLLEEHPNIQILRGEVERIPPEGAVILASGPLTSDALAAELAALTGEEHLAFFDAIAPVLRAESLDSERVFAASRYGKGGDDYLNCPMNRMEYERFHAALVEAERYPLHEFEKAGFFEGCLPIEEIARRGVDTLRFGPLKPAGLDDPRTGRWAHAVVQLRRENLLADACNMVGFQTNLRQSEQQRVFRMIPGLEKAEFVRYGQMHRNTYLNAPAALEPTLELKARPGLWVAGQLCGLEGYLEAMATGLMAALQVQRRLRGLSPVLFPRETALGSLQHALSFPDTPSYTPVNITHNLLPPVPEEAAGVRKTIRGRHARNAWRYQRAREAFQAFLPTLPEASWPS